ncbi:MAG: peptidoglycan-binding protein [candidate division Zixibacteria bacterium]|nr:peptidoglycan-binding protein [candidate division Zixibacteria bacterium]
MTNYRLGSKGAEVREIQRKLKALSYYRGPTDGIFGGGTQAAVKAFQKSKRLAVDGIVGPITWRALFGKRIPTPSIMKRPLGYRCLALTGSFETGEDFPDCFAGLSGDFDGQGMSLGVLQWNFGQDSLQPLLKEMANKHPKIIKGIFGAHYAVLLQALKSGKEELITFARSIQHPFKHYVYEPWRGMFKSLGRTGEFQDIQVRHAHKLFKSALRLCSGYGLWSERAVALMFDIKVQNGSIGRLVKAQIIQESNGLPKSLTKNELEVEKMRIVANRRAEASNPRWVEDVRARKLCCANGRGIVHGIDYDLEAQFGIRLKPYRIKE